MNGSAAHEGFEAMLADVSARLLAVSPEDFDAELQRTVERFVQHFNADRGGIGQFDAEGGLRTTHQFATEGFMPVPIGPLDFAPAWVSLLRAGSGLVLRNPAEIPTEWTREIEYARAVGLKAQIAFPLRVGASLIGFIALDRSADLETGRKSCCSSSASSARSSPAQSCDIRKRPTFARASRRSRA